jgi:hypothetical protein
MVGRLPIFAAVAFAMAAAQTQPDFSGRWVLERSEGAGVENARALVVRQPVVRENVYGVPIQPVFLQITVERQFAAATRTDTYCICRGGRVGGVTAGGQSRGPTSSFFVRWEENRLVIDTATSAGENGLPVAHTEVWQLDANGTLTVKIEDRVQGAEPRTGTATYRRATS